jgi:hypothetical protein
VSATDGGEVGANFRAQLLQHASAIDLRYFFRRFETAGECLIDKLHLEKSSL